ncbi:ribonuclease HII [Silanimonas sp.]|uniref:ribonuclease HII n=1 Tax=Silanimonas sp. TaxID=1929290 RepID=UPI0022C3822B|nr:ribonuclease HII [Silanimonas sp.]MCZ8063485.1 ribonuclease HII [Silanimonas sp.]
MIDPSWTVPGVAGVDEAGRGPLAGPVAVAAVILDPARRIDGLGDSKALSEARREALFPRIQSEALAFAIVFVHADEIDRLNILQATMAGMRRAVAALATTPSRVLVDGNRVPPGLGIAAEAIVKGDAKIAAISAASILAKVARDRWMLDLNAAHPEYGFAAHKGYPTPEHLDALRRFGPCPAHRRSFAPVRASMVPPLLD